jgi:hypothetical protein
MKRLITSSGRLLLLNALAVSFLAANLCEGRLNDYTEPSHTCHGPGALEMSGVTAAREADAEFPPALGANFVWFSQTAIPATGDVVVEDRNPGPNMSAFHTLASRASPARLSIPGGGHWRSWESRSLQDRFPTTRAVLLL